MRQTSIVCRFGRRGLGQGQDTTSCVMNNLPSRGLVAEVVVLRFVEIGWNSLIRLARPNRGNQNSLCAATRSAYQPSVVFLLTRAEWKSRVLLTYSLLFESWT